MSSTPAVRGQVVEWTQTGDRVVDFAVNAWLNSSLVPGSFKTNGQVDVGKVIFACAYLTHLDLDPLVDLKNCYVVDGRPELMVELLRVLAGRAGYDLQETEDTREASTWRIRVACGHPLNDPDCPHWMGSYRFTTDDIPANFKTKDNYKNWQRAMVSARACGWLINRYAPEVKHGIDVARTDATRLASRSLPGGPPTGPNLAAAGGQGPTVVSANPPPTTTASEKERRRIRALIAALDDVTAQALRDTWRTLQPPLRPVRHAELTSSDVERWEDLIYQVQDRLAAAATSAPQSQAGEPGPVEEGPAPDTEEGPAPTNPPWHPLGYEPDPAEDHDETEMEWADDPGRPFTDEESDR